MSSIFFPNASSSSSNSYVPSKIIVSTHNIPHLNAQLQPSSNIFGLEYNQPWNTYTQSILPIPIAIGILGCLSILILTISLLARPLFGRCKCSPKERFTADGEIDKSICVSPTFFSMKNLQFIFYATAFLAIIADQALYFGNVYISNGVSSSVSSINTLSNTFNNINAQNLALIVSMNSLTSDAALCGQSSHIVFNPMMTKLYNNSVSSLTNYIAPIPTSLSHVSDTLTTYGTTNKNNSIWILYGCVIAVILSFQIGMCVSNKRALQVSIVMSELLILAFIVICAIEMFLVVSQYISLFIYLVIFVLYIYAYSYFVILYSSYTSTYIRIDNIPKLLNMHVFSLVHVYIDDIF